MRIKEIAIKSIKELPDEVTWEDIKGRIDFIAGVRKGLTELDEGRYIEHEDIKRELKEWISK
ncbi:MAG: hypothetical protein MAG551_01356 [Candidatus Scalindua arabica]|uniref:Uncharacterized protein n=1 Tax=Candidatus Scalindua arabica TaxID=1127984 RepID=A0A942A429_9BACT|nr:hypothetical protein [Candidatus Scalindua arabica]